MSDKIWFQKAIGARDGFEGFWMCPTPNCDGAGFTFDIFPTDPNHPANAGWSDGGDEEEEDEDEQEWDAEEAKYAEMDEDDGVIEDDLEGEEWKQGLQPSDAPVEPPWAEEARKRHEEEQKKYDGPDLRPREVDWSNRPEPPPAIDGEDPIPF